MGYTRKWTPPTIPLRDDLNAWKLLFNDLNDNLILAGWEQTTTEGQLVIDDVTELPADGSFAGFKEFIYADQFKNEAPIVIRLEYGCGTEGYFGQGSAAYGRTRTISVRVTITFKGQLVRTYTCPQPYTQIVAGSNVTTQLTTTGVSYCTSNQQVGFFGFLYGVGSRNKPFSYVSGEYYGATLALLIQRTQSEMGAPTPDGLATYCPNLSPSRVTSSTSLWTAGLIWASVSTYCTGAETVVRDDLAPRIGREGLSGGIDGVLMESIYYPTNPPTPFPYLFSYRNNMITPGAEIMFTPSNGTPRKYIALGNETCLAPDKVDAQYAGIVMLFE